MGLDAVECSSFRIKGEKYEGIWYMVPRRKRPKIVSELAGFDWACSTLERLPYISPEGIAEFWQAFTNFPEVWQCLANLPWKADELPRVWGLGQNWGFWNPNTDQVKDALHTAQCRPSRLLKRIIGESCQLSGTTESNMTWPERLRDLLLKSLEQSTGGKMIGMIIDGPFAPSTAPPWLRACFPYLQEMGLDTSGPHDTPELGKIWCSPMSDAIARGAAIFGKRLLNGAPTYLDTLPQLSLLAKRDTTLALFPLVEAQNVRGGEEYINSIKHQFMLEEAQSKLDVILVKGISDAEWLAPINDRLDNHICRVAEGLTLGSSSLVRHLIRSQSSTKAALHQLRERSKELKSTERHHLLKLKEQELVIGNALEDLRKSSDLAVSRYAVTFEALYIAGSAELSVSEKSGLPLKKVSSPFPSPSPRVMPVDIMVRIRPASGRAKMEVIPEDTSFLRGRHVFVDYATMEDLKEVPSGGQGWPPLEEMVPHSDQSLWGFIHSSAQRFLTSTPGTDMYKALLERVYDRLRSRPTFAEFGLRFFMVNQEGAVGCPEGSGVVSIIAQAVAQHAETLMSASNLGRRGAHQAGSIRLPASQSALLRSLIVRGSWLFGATPEALLKPMRYVLLGRLIGITQGQVIAAAGRAFTTAEDLALLSRAIIRRIKQVGNNPFPLQSMNAICQVLMYRPNGQDALDSESAHLLLDECCKVLDEHAKALRFKNKFFQGIRLLLYLLRYRKREATFLEKDSISARRLLNKLDWYEEQLKQVLTGARRTTAVSIIGGIKDFVNFAGSVTTLDLLAAVLDGDGAGEDGE
jgi:hypothetical protein